MATTRHSWMIICMKSFQVWLICEHTPSKDSRSHWFGRKSIAFKIEWNRCKKPYG